MRVPTGLNRHLCRWIAKKKRLHVSQALVGSKGDKNTRRWWIFRPDEWWDDRRGQNNALPWWRPFNVFLHRWDGSDTGHPHNHPRWTITIVLRGGFMEQTQTREFWRTPGSVVFRRASYIHRVIVPKRLHRKTYTLFIVGRRTWKQSYLVKGQLVGVDDFESQEDS